MEEFPKIILQYFINADRKLFNRLVISLEFRLDLI